MPDGTLIPCVPGDGVLEGGGPRRFRLSHWTEHPAARRIGVVRRDDPGVTLHVGANAERSSVPISMTYLTAALESFRRAEALSYYIRSDPWALILWSVDIDHLSRVLQVEGSLEAAVIGLHITGELRALKRYDEAASNAQEAIGVWSRPRRISRGRMARAWLRRELKPGR